MSAVRPGRACPTCAGDLDADCHSPGCLSASQVAALAARVYCDGPRRRPGRRPAKDSPHVSISRDELVAKTPGLTASMLDEAIAVRRALVKVGDLNRLRKLEEGKITVGRVYDEVTRKKRRADLLGNVSTLPPGRYDVVLADPPWQYRDGGVGRRGAAESHYPTQSFDALMAMRPKIDEIAADDSVLLLWTTVPLATEGYALLHSWGYEYVTQFVWIKTDCDGLSVQGPLGMGWTVRVDHEVLLVGKRGAGLPVADHSVRSVIFAPRAGHSVKPAAAFEAIECLWPHVRKIELFARRARAGWAAWGAEAPGPAEAVRKPKSMEANVPGLFRLCNSDSLRGSSKH